MPIYYVGLEVTITEDVAIAADSPEEAEEIAKQEGWMKLTCGRCCWEITKQEEVTLETIGNPFNIPKGPLGYNEEDKHWGLTNTIIKSR